MKNLQHKFFGKNALIVTSLLLAIFSGCSDSDKGDSAVVPTVADVDPEISNVLTSDRSIWIPYYQLPSDWQINLDNPEIARSKVEQGLPGELKVSYLGPAEQNLPLATLRDQAYQQVYCQGDGQGIINCTKGFSKTTDSIAGFQTESVRYYGTWQSESREVHEIFVNREGQILHLTTEGEFSKILPALESLLQTIQWKLEKPSVDAAQQPEEMGL